MGTWNKCEWVGKISETNNQEGGGAFIRYSSVPIELLAFVIEFHFQHDVIFHFKHIYSGIQLN